MSKIILSVSSNKAMSFLLQTIFENQYHFLSSSDVFQAVHKLRSDKRINALIVDVDFEPEQCWELIQHVKSSKLYRIPVVILATVNSETVRQKSYEYEIDEIFFKPFNPVDLITAVKNLVSAPIINSF